MGVYMYVRNAMFPRAKYISHPMFKHNGNRLYLELALFPGLPHLQLLIACILQVIKNWRCGKPAASDHKLEVWKAWE